MTLFQVALARFKLIIYFIKSLHRDAIYVFELIL